MAGGVGRINGVRLAAAVLAAGLAAACQSGGIAPMAMVDAANMEIVDDSDGDLVMVAALSPPANAGAATRIAAGDVLAIDVFNVEELDRRPRVDAGGTVSMPLIGPVMAAGTTPAELERQLEAAYGRQYLRDPEVTVDIVESTTQRITLDGEFRSPGVYDIAGRTSLLQVTAQAGGLNDIADAGRVFVFRPVAGGRHVARYSLNDIRAGRATDLRVYGGDIVIAFPSGARIAGRNLREALGLAGSATRLAGPL